MQKWKKDPKLYDCPMINDKHQKRKKLDYSNVYKKEFLESDPLRDWESIDRCKWLWNWALEKIDDKFDDSWCTVLDCGTKDGKFPEYLHTQNIAAIGIEYSDSYVEYSQNLGRPVIKGDVCNLDFDDNKFDFVFSHHLHGLTSDYWKALQEMFRVSKKYMIALNQVPGNPKKHYSYIDSSKIFHDFIEENKCKVLWNDYLDTGYPNEWVIFLEKNE